MHGAERFRDLQSEATARRRYLHQNPELDYRVHKTGRFVTEKLASFGINRIEMGIAETGIVALIQGEGGDGPTIGLRADMDALPILEASNKPWSSKIPGKPWPSCRWTHNPLTALFKAAAKANIEPQQIERVAARRRTHRVGVARGLGNSGR